MEDNTMLENTQTEETNETEKQSGKTFTQEEVAEIVQRRLARDRKSRPADADLQDREKALQDRENTLYAKERFLDEKIPGDLIELVAGKGKEDIDKAIKILKPYIDKMNEPSNDSSGRASWGMRQGVASRSGDKIREAMGLK